MSEIRITLRRAAPEESAGLTRVAHEAKRHWGYPERWIEAWSRALTVTPELIASHHVYVATDAAAIAGFYALMSKGVDWSLEHMWVRPAFMGRGVGRLLLGHAVELARAAGAATIQIESDPNAVGFYERMGAVRKGEVRADVDGSSRTLPSLELAVPRMGDPAPGPPCRSVKARPVAERP